MPALGFELASSAEEIMSQCLDRFDEIKQACDAAVTEWRWSSAVMFDPRPWHVPYWTREKGKWLAKRRRDKYGGDHLYGLDADGRVIALRIIGRSDTVDGDELLVREDFFVYLPSRIVELYYVHDLHYGVGLTSVSTTRLDDGGLPISYVYRHDSHSVAKETQETYVYEEDRLASTEIAITTKFGTQTAKHTYSYDQNGDMLRIIAESQMGGRVLVYQKPSPDRLSKPALIEKATAELVDAGRECINAFRAEFPDDHWYAFAFVASCEGTSVYCAIATEEGMDPLVELYAPPRESVRWMGVEDGWRRYLLNGKRIPEPPLSREQMMAPIDEDCTFNRTLNAAFAEVAFRIFDGNTQKLCIAALKRLDAAGDFGTGVDRDKIAIGYTTMEDLSDFERTMKKLNPPAVVSRVRREMK